MPMMRLSALILIAVATLPCWAADEAPRRETAAASVTTRIPDVHVVSAAGEQFVLSGFRGKPLLVEVWASWCAPCIAGLPTLDAIQRDYRAKGLQVVPVSIDQNGVPAAVNAYAKANVKHLPLYMANASTVLGALRSRTIPLAILYDAQGREFARFEKPRGSNDHAIRSAINQLFQDQKP